jgi:hypothetical protein
MNPILFQAQWPFVEKKCKNKSFYAVGRVYAIISGNEVFSGDNEAAIVLIGR